MFFTERKPLIQSESSGADENLTQFTTIKTANSKPDL